MDNNLVVHIVICNTKYDDGTNKDVLMRIYSTADKAIEAVKEYEERAKENGVGNCCTYRVESWIVW